MRRRTVVWLLTVTAVQVLGTCLTVQAQPAINAPEGFSVQSADGQYQLRLRGYIHTDARLLVSGAEGVAESTFLLRRVRPIVEATLFERFDLRVMPDFGEGRTTLQDAYLDIRFTGLIRVRAGKFKSPFGQERLTSATDLLLSERSAPTLLAPNRDVGFMAHGETRSRRFSYSLGLLNGVPDGASGDTDETSGKDVVGRVTVRPFSSSSAPALQPLMLAAAFSAGRERGRVAAPALPQFRSAGQQVFFRLRSDGTPAGTSVADGDRTRASLQARWYFDRVGLSGELTSSKQDVRAGDDGGRLDAMAWMLTGVCVLSKDQASTRSIVPREAFDPAAGHWGAFELTGRVSRIAIDDSIFPSFANPLTSARSALEWALGVNWYLNRAVKLASSFHDTRFEGGSEAGSRRAERLVLTRIQFAF